MLKSLYKNPELLRFSIFIVWLINVSGFFGMFSDQKELFLTFTPYAILMSFILIFINSKINQKGFITSILTIAIFGFIIEMCSRKKTEYLLISEISGFLLLGGL